VSPSARSAQVLRFAFLAFWVLVCVLIWRNALPESRYGDGYLLEEYLRTGNVFPRWPLGMLWLVAFHSVFPGVSAAVLASTSMLVSSWLLLTRWPNRWMVICPLLTPVWLLFSSGYVEYYPFIAGAFVATMAWVLERPVHERSGRDVGMLSGLMSALYIGFAPLSALLVALRPKRAAIWAAVTFTLLITACEPRGLPTFLNAMFKEMSLGEANMFDPHYIGQVAGPHSIFFKTSFAFSLQHLRNLLYMDWWGGGMFFAVLLIWAAWKARRFRWDGRAAFGAACLGWQLYYFVFMVPHYGPMGDIDLFFST
jgi:hypothetical protein